MGEGEKREGLLENKDNFADFHHHSLYYLAYNKVENTHNELLALIYYLI